MNGMIHMLICCAVEMLLWHLATQIGKKKKLDEQWIKLIDTCGSTLITLTLVVVDWGIIQEEWIKFARYPIAILCVVRLFAKLNRIKKTSQGEAA